KNEKASIKQQGSNAEWKRNSESCRAKICQKHQAPDFRFSDLLSFLRGSRQVRVERTEDRLCAGLMATRFSAARDNQLSRSNFSITPGAPVWGEVVAWDELLVWVKAWA